MRAIGCLILFCAVSLREQRHSDTKEAKHCSGQDTEIKEGGFRSGFLFHRTEEFKLHFTFTTRILVAINPAERESSGALRRRRPTDLARGARLPKIPTLCQYKNIGRHPTLRGIRIGGDSNRLS